MSAEKFKLKPYFEAGQIEAGCDEAGRGCLAGPVMAAAVILPENFYHPDLNDSKQLTHKQRSELRAIIESQSIAWSVAQIDNNEIDKINILNASIKAMHLAVTQLSVRPTFLIIDGNKFHKYQDIPHKCIVKGDATYLSIAAASILAKTHRDEFMATAHATYSNYGWDKNKGYPTKMHRHGIEIHGITPLHRKTYKLTDGQIKIEFE
jgi:ribonuclease HII